MTHSEDTKEETRDEGSSVGAVESEMNNSSMPKNGDLGVADSDDTDERDDAGDTEVEGGTEENEERESVCKSETDPPEEDVDAGDEEPLDPPSSSIDHQEQTVDDDDLAYLKEFESSDEVVIDERDFKAFAQNDSALIWRIDGFYDGDSAVSMSDIKNNPPVLTVDSVDEIGNETSASFVLSQEFTKTLNYVLDDVHRVYTGRKIKKDMTARESFSETLTSFVSWVNNNPIKAGLLFVFLVVSGIVIINAL